MYGKTGRLVLFYYYPGLWPISWVYTGLCNSPSVLVSLGAVFPGHRKGVRVVPHPAPCELSSQHKPGSFGASFGAVLGAVLGMPGAAREAQNPNEPPGSRGKLAHLPIQTVKLRFALDAALALGTPVSLRVARLVFAK